jgi:hypothetical protein
MVLYLVAFVLAFWPKLAGEQARDMWLDAVEVAALEDSMNATAQEMLRLMNIAALESGFRRDAKGKQGELGPWQVMPPAMDYGAKEALRRMRSQGMLGYCGCRSANVMVNVPGGQIPCGELVAHRIDRADLYLMGFEPPRSVTADVATTVAAPATFAEIERAH